jgi:hypothetical protein
VVISFLPRTILTPSGSSHNYFFLSSLGG